MPLQPPPLHPVKRAPAPYVFCRSVMNDPGAKVAEHGPVPSDDLKQSMPAGLLVTVPPHEPAEETVRCAAAVGCQFGSSANVSLVTRVGFVPFALRIQIAGFVKPLVAMPSSMIFVPSGEYSGLRSPMLL